MARAADSEDVMEVADAALVAEAGLAAAAESAEVLEALVASPNWLVARG